MATKSKQNVTVTREWLAERGYTLRQAAEDVGVSATHLGLVCRGERVPSKGLLARLRRLPKYHPIKVRLA